LFENLHQDGGAGAGTGAPHTHTNTHTNKEGLPYSPRGMESRTGFLTSDLEETALADQSKHDAAQQILDQMEQMLSQADRSLDNVEQEDMLGSAIVRSCQDLADAIGGIASHLDQQSDEDRRLLAQACLEDAQNTLLLQEEENAASGSSRDTISMGTTIERRRRSSELQEFSQLSEDDMMNALSVAKSLLKDVEATLRAIDQDEADEIADVALTVARLFIASMHSIHSTISPHDLTGAVTNVNMSRSLESSDRIEILDEDYNAVMRDTEEESSSAEATSKSGAKKKRLDHLRVLWPPLGPGVASACSWGKEAAAKQPFLAVALGLTLWPAAVITTMVGGPLVLADGFAQDLYNNFQDGPIIQGIERSAAQLYHTGRLNILVCKLVGRQTFRVASRQVKRRGGVGKIAQDIGGMAVDRVTHPIETVEMAWGGISWGAGILRDTVEQMTEHLTDQEQEERVQSLQQ
jgi:hypothetical protein